MITCVRVRADLDQTQSPHGIAGPYAQDRSREGRRLRRDAAAEFPSTSHGAIVDGQGNAVSMTSTIEDGSDSRLMTEGGFMLNNELTDFSFVPVDEGKPVANRVEPGKRPRSSMAPTIAYDRSGRVAIVTGSPGGSAIIDYVVKTLLG